MPSYEYIGVRAVLAGMSQFRSDTAIYNQLLKQMSDATNSFGDTSVKSAQATSNALDNQAKALKDDATAARAAADEIVAAEDRKIKAILATADASIAAWQKQGEAALKEAADEVAAADTAARSARARAAYSRTAPITASQLASGVGSYGVPQAQLDQQEAAANKALDDARTKFQATAATTAAGFGVIEEGAARQVEAEARAAASAESNAQALERQAASAATAAAQQKLYATALGVGKTEIDAFSAGLTKAMQVTLDFGKALTLASGAGLIALGAGVAYTTAQYGKYQDSLAEVEGATNSNAAQTERLGQAELDLARATRTPLADIQQMAVDAGRAGLNADQLTSGILKQVNTLALASGGELSYADAVKTVATAQQALGVPVTQLNGLIDSLAKANAETTLTFTDLTGAFRTAAPAARSLGLDYNELIAIISVVGKSLGSGVQAGTNLNQMFTRLANPPKAAAAQLNAWGVSLKDGSGNARNMVLVMQDLYDAYQRDAQKLGQVNADQELFTVFNTRSARAVLSILNDNRDALAQFDTSLQTSTGFAQNAANIFENTLPGALSRLENAFKADAVLAGQEWAPTLTNAITKIGAALNSPQAQANIASFSAGVLASLRQLATQAQTELLPALRNLAAAFGLVGGDGNLLQAALRGIMTVGSGLITFFTQLVTQATNFVNAIRKNQTAMAIWDAATRNIASIGLAGMAAAILALFGPLAELAAGVLAVSAAISGLNALVREHPALFGAAVAVIAPFMALVGAAAVAARITATANAIAGIGTALGVLTPEILAGAAAFAPWIIALAAVGVGADLLMRNYSNAMEQAKTAGDRQAEANKTALDKVNANLNNTSLAGAAWAIAMSNAANNVSTSFDHASAEVVRDMAQINAAAQQARDSSALLDVTAGPDASRLSSEFNRFTNNRPKSSNSSDGGDYGPGSYGAGAPYDTASKGADKLAQKQKEVNDAIAAAVDHVQQLGSQYQQTTDQIVQDYNRQTAQANESYARQTLAAKEAFDQQTADAKLAFQQQEADRQLAYQQQRADALAQRAFDEQLQVEQQAFSRQQQAEQEAFSNQEAIDKINRDYNNKLGNDQAALQDKLAVAKSDKQKKQLQLEFDLQKKALDRQHATDLANEQAQEADQKEALQFQQKLQDEADAFQKQQDAKRIAFEDAQAQQQFDRQTAAAQQAFDRQQAAALQTFNRETAARSAALNQQLADYATAKEQELTDQQTTLTRELTNLETNLDLQLKKINQTDAEAVAESNRVSAALSDNLQQIINQANAAASAVSRALGKAPPTPIVASTYTPATFDTGGIAGRGPWGSHIPALLSPTETVMTPTQVMSLINNVSNIVTRSVVNNFNVGGFTANYAQQQSSASVRLDLQALQALARG